MRIVWLAPFPIDQIPGVILKNKNTKGRGNWLVNLSKALCDNQNVDLHIISYSANIYKNQTIKLNNCTYHILKHSVPFINKGYPNYARLDILLKFKGISGKIIKLIKSIKPDIIHAHGTENAYSYIASKIKNIPNITSLQGIIAELIKIEKNPYYKLQVGIEKTSIQKNKNFACRTNWDKGFVNNINENARIFYLSEAISDDFFKLNWDGIESHSILFVGTIIKRKGIEDLISVMQNLIKEFPQIELKIIGYGDSDYIKSLQKQTSTLEIEGKIKWLGFLNSEQIAKEMIDARCFILPSYSDNSPNSLCEAMAIGMPVIAYGTGGIPSLINNGENGILVETGNINELIRATKKILSTLTLCSTLSINAKKKALERNSPRKVANSTLTVYKEILSS